MVLLIEGIILCVAFTLMVFVMSRKPINTLYNYPPRIQDLAGLVVQFIL